MYDSLTDRQLLIAFENGDHGAFEHLYTKYWGILFNEARRILKDSELASDAVQDVFMTLLTRCDQAKQIESPANFLYTSIRNRAINSLTHQKVKDTFVRYVHQYQFHELTYTEEEIFQTRSQLDKDLRERVEAAIADLPPKMRTAFELSKKNELSYKEIAKRTGTTEGTIKKQISNALDTLRKKLLSTFFSFF
ncbi:RNA polymerase sigma factor [Chitinophaga sp. Ak27]|uniref:RNA polymerase sigma factor n=1 Tax=Chitinophaga sp. Ak27 TaxID=2726116 RepID=UPI00145F82E6|nr:RNA polymerase sigma-70 factor [Chitinophaga sp. Ak27]NLU94878.1 RNA polymerase sigma-70 factor [Chitinophaga sp. Ak27]